MIKTICCRLSCCGQYNFTIRRSLENFLSRLPLSDFGPKFGLLFQKYLGSGVIHSSHKLVLVGVNDMMSGSGTEKKGKPLIQTKLSFTCVSSSDSNNTHQASNKGPKRKLEATDDNMDPDIRKKVLEAAEKRQKVENSIKCDGSSTDSPYFNTRNSKTACPSGKKADEAVASTSAGSKDKKVGDTMEYEMADLSGSQDLFATSDSDLNMTDSQNSMAEEEEDPSLYKKPCPWDANRPWRGKPLDKLNTAPACLPPGQKLKKSDDHDICIKLPFQYTDSALPVPHPSSYKDAWDENHVRMPCSNQSQYPVNQGGNNVRLERRWDLITKALKGTITCSADLEEAILSYNQRYVSKWNFACLHHYFRKYLKPADSQHFFDQVLPQMIRLVLKLPHLCTHPIPLLKKGKAHKVTLSQQQIACLLANAFFCTFPRRNSKARNAEFSSYPDINFNSLFQGYPISRKMEKLNCIIHYFKRVCYNMPKGIVTFSRQVMPKSYEWRNSNKGLKDLHVSSAGTIEDNGIGMLQVDFANKYLGGGVLNTGCVQEEIRFMICPEMIISRLITEVLGEMECLVMTGCEQFSEYEGYADSFKWKDDFQDQTQRDSMGRLCCEVVAIDALVFRNNYYRQFSRPSIMRELNKAYCGFMSTAEEKHRAAVCTGNWGCGAFGGDKQIKSLIQMMAASAAERDMCYFTFEDEQLTEDLHRVHATLRSEEKTLSEIMKLLDDYNKEVVEPAFRRPSVSLFKYIRAKLEGTMDSQDNSLPSSLGPDFDEDSNEAQVFGGEKGSAGDKSPDYKADTP